MAVDRSQANADGTIVIDGEPTVLTMLSRQPSALVDEVMAGLQACGWTEVSRDATRSQPKWLTIERGGEQQKLALYIWTLGFGGREKYPRERRIQIGDSVRGRLKTGADFETLLIGYYERNGAKAIAAFDVSRHLEPNPHNSCQVEVESVARAMRDGFDLHQNTKGEHIAVFRPELIDVYRKYREAIHSGLFLTPAVAEGVHEGGQDYAINEPSSYLLMIHDASFLDDENDTLLLNKDEHGDIKAGDTLWLIIANEQGTHLTEKAEVALAVDNGDTALFILEDRQRLDMRLSLQELAERSDLLPEPIRNALQLIEG